MKLPSSRPMCVSPKLISESLHPHKVVVDFDNSINYDAKTFRVNASLPLTNNTDCRQLVIWLGMTDYGERELPVGGGALCANTLPGRLAIDTLFIESWVYGCCRLTVPCTSKICTFTCPLPPLNLLAETLDETINGWTNYLYATNQAMGRTGNKSWNVVICFTCTCKCNVQKNTNT